MNCRTFLRRFTSGVVAAAVLVHVPAAVLKAAPRLAEPARLWACERLRETFTAYQKANSHKGLASSLPAGMRVGREFFAIYEGELPPIHQPTLMFKGVPVYIGLHDAPYHCEAVAVIEYAQAIA